MNNPIKLFRYTKDKANLFWDIYNDDKYYEFFRRIPPSLRKEDIENIESITSSDMYSCEMDCDVLGFAVVTKIDWYGLGAQVGLVLLDKYQDESRNGHKLAFWAILALARILFDKMPLRRMSFKFLAKRIDIERSLQKGGLRREGYFDKSCIVNGIFEDELEYCLDKDHYEVMYK